MRFGSLGLRLVLWLIPSWAAAEIRVAFFRFPDGEVGDRFYHVALEVTGPLGKRWISAEPYWGVRVVDDLSKISHQPVVFLIQKKLADLRLENLSRYIGMPFDSDMDWQREDRMYCSKLIAKILQIAPTPMSFSDPRWPKHLQARVGAVGISPDEVFQSLQSLGYVAEPRSVCESKFSTAVSAP